MTRVQNLYTQNKLLTAGLMIVFAVLISGCGQINFPRQPATVTAPPATEVVESPAPPPASQTPTLVATTPAPSPGEPQATEAPDRGGDHPVPSPTWLASQTPTPTAMPTQVYTYLLQAGSPSFVPNIFRQELGCNWMGVGGQVFDTEGQPVTGLIVEISGELDGREILELSISGGAPQYGLGGFEITLADHPIASQGQLSVVLYNLQNEPQSEKIYFDTLDDCTHNLVIVNFLENDFFQSRYYLPVMNNASP